MNLIELMAQAPTVQQVLTKLVPHTKQLLTGLNGSAQTLFLATMYQQQQHAMLIVEPDTYHANQLADDLSNLLPDELITTFNVNEVLAAEIAVSSPEVKSNRIQALTQLANDQNGIVVTSVAGMRRILPTVAMWQKAQIKVSQDGELDPQKLTAQLINMGYERQSMVAKPGEFAIRGDIIDIYSLTASYPVRIELFDTEVDSLRYFDPNTQRSLDNIDSFTILPATDLLVDEPTWQQAQQTLQKQYQQALSDHDVDAQLLKQNVGKQLEDLQQRISDPNLLLLSDYLYPQKTSLLDYLSDDGWLIIDDYQRLMTNEQRLNNDTFNWLSDLLSQGMILKNTQLVNQLRDLLHHDQHSRLYLSLFQKGMGRLHLDGINNLVSHEMQRFFSQMPLLKTEVAHWQKQQRTIVMLVDDPQRITKLDQTLHDFEISAVLTGKNDLQTKHTQLVTGTLKTGFEIPDANLVVITEHELFNKVQMVHHRRQPTLENAERLRSYNDLQPGDYVVHVNHGIGKFIGMQTLEVDGVHQDYMTILYQNDAKLFIPVTQLNLIQKYVSFDDKAPHINRLGGSDWQKTKRKVANKIEDIADELIDLYAQREAEKGFAFSPDDEYQKKFEAAFPYVETPDQLRSIDEVKHDMEKPHPMDRLLVGDVGFGKTEVALRAAFKAVQDNKQVAFLVPTTILAQQHYDTMLTRFSGFPVNIGILSRFRTTKQIKETLAGLKDGSVDIVVGTHRLLSKDVHFKDLGLLIVDEEQRFGVKHKEKLKQLKANIDVLTLTATPIPRTLHMSMLGVRNLSVIETPPTNRYPIQTYVMEQNDEAIREAINRELERHGQVFYLHNRIDDIESVVSRLQELVPNARITYVHGRMSENQLENVIYAFLNDEYDVLVTTTIIETGVDMPNVNTLIVENADHYGLSQLYQLRGRIGRSSRVAYAYLTYPANKVLTEVSEQRLQAIRDFTELGAGFKIAMRDLSIRGAGNLLGKQQHGFIDSVGYDLYSQMLADAIARKRGKKQVQKTNSEMDIRIEAYLPSDYISDNQQKIEMYKRIRTIASDDDYWQIQSDLIDRFGEYPDAVKNLLMISRIKMLADLALIDSVKQRDDYIVINMSRRGSQLLSGSNIFDALAATKLSATVKTINDAFQIKLVIQPHMTTDQWMNEIIALVTALLKLVQKHITNN